MKVPISGHLSPELQAMTVIPMNSTHDGAQARARADPDAVRRHATPATAAAPVVPPAPRTPEETGLPLLLLAPNTFSVVAPLAEKHSLTPLPAESELLSNVYAE